MLRAIKWSPRVPRTMHGVAACNLEPGDLFNLKSHRSGCDLSGTLDAVLALRARRGAIVMSIDAGQSLRHNFAIWVMGRRPGLFKPQRYTYRCLRCKWTFIVNDEYRGSIRVAFDRSGELSAAEAVRRLATFEMGPCSGLDVLAPRAFDAEYQLDNQSAEESK
jgi:hypothetical protein